MQNETKTFLKTKYFAFALCTMYIEGPFTKYDTVIVSNKWSDFAAFYTCFFDFCTSVGQKAHESYINIIDLNESTVTLRKIGY